MSRQDSLRRMSSLVGNAAAHRALDPDNPFTLREAVLYETQAEDASDMRRWNENEIVRFRDLAIRYAANVIKRRTTYHRGRTERELIDTAIEKIDGFIAGEIKRKRNKYR